MARIPKKLLEHYGISVPVSSAQKITQAYAAKRVEGTSNSDPDSGEKGGPSAAQWKWMVV